MPWSIEDYVDNTATKVVNKILETLREDHENEAVHEDHQEMWEAVIVKEMLCAIKAAGNKGGTEASTPPDQKDLKHDLASLLAVTEKLIFGLNSGAPADWIKREVQRASEVFWFVKNENGL